jgi:hypothetical protein
MARIARFFVLTALILPAAGCLVKDTTHTLYVDRQGSLTWLALETDVRAVDDDPAVRAREEAAYAEEAAAGDHGVARALARLRPTDLRTVTIRDRAPYAVATEARFASLDGAASQLIAALGVPGRSRLTRDGGLTRWRLEIDLATPAAGDDDSLTALAEDVDRYRVVLTDGRFVDAVGFALRDDGRTAVPLAQDLDALERDGQPLVLELTWR